jgi:hypothetical protein
MAGFTDPGIWNEAYGVLATGQPPVIFQILLFNTAMMVLWSFRRARGVWAIRRETAIVIQVILIVGNIVILLNPDPEFGTLPI